VRKLLAGVVLVLFASLTGLDGVCCPDDCTHERPVPSQTRSQDATDGICLLCLGGVDSTVQQDLSARIVVTGGIERPPFAQHADAPSTPVEHPPRA
jgi:hypothetical protein